MSTGALTLELFVVLLTVSARQVRGSLRNVTGDIMGTDTAGKVAAFGDFNADKQTDMFLIRNGNELRILLADVKSTPYFNPKVKLPLSEDIVITSVVPGDYNGDSQMDVLLTTVPKGQAGSPLSAVIYWGQNQTLNINNKTHLSKTYLDEPLIMDFNGDLIPDIFGVPSGSKIPLIIHGGDLSANSTLDTKREMFNPHSHAFIDLNGDFTADLFLTSVSESKEHQFETWTNEGGNFTEPKSTIPKPKDVKVVGQAVFADFDGDGLQDLLLPACADEKCFKSAIYLWKSGQWVPVLQDFRNQNTVWGFVPPTAPTALPITLHIGDYNMDGYPDALAILRDTSGSDQQAFLLENVLCKNTTCSRIFEVHWEISDLNQIKDAVVATFFDFYEDGILDIIVLGKGSSPENFAIHVFLNNFEADAYFVKVIVLSGFCSNDCPHQVKPFGVNQPGPYIMYTTVDANGYLKNASVGQLSQSAHLALQLPYNVLGLGRSANFLDHLFVGIPRPLGEKQIRKQEWTAIIPNSQLIVIPYPHHTPKSWSAKLYLTPSNIVLLTAIALIGVCVFILAIIGILHWQEKKADDREKRQEAHRFHFDAM
ncbi:T-cell immunomodulatory protein [Spea bombifrons]|uniref:T-cell immunomodulatory protein n=1 Tax=Spea bombifrons TaxID=233779 RepID=UPI00234B571E|nr:T-cell immunomodulatory protein [Spea bombifrons]